MHAAQRDFIQSVRTLHPEMFSGQRVLELGSYNINGTVRDFFDDPSEYVGVDWREGPCVDVVSLCQDLDLGKEFDVLISSEMLEHDPYWRQSLKAGVEHLRSGGLVIMTCASAARGRHEVETSPGNGYYQGVDPSALGTFMESLQLDGCAVFGDCGKDTYYSGIKL